MPNEVQHKSKVIDNQDITITRTGRFEWFDDGTIHFLFDPGEPNNNPGDPNNDIGYWTPWTGRPTVKKLLETGPLQVISGNLVFEKIGPQRYILRYVDEAMISLALHKFTENKSLRDLDSVIQNR